MKFNLAKPILALLVSATMITSCTPDEPEAPVVVKEYGKIQIFHAAVDAPAIDFLVDGTKVNTDSLSYQKGTPYYQALLTTGKKNIYKIVGSKSGQSISTDSLQMNTTDVGYSVFVYQDKDAAGTIRSFYSPDNLLSPTAGKAKIRLVHLIPDANVNIDVELVAPGGSASTSSQFPNVAFPKIMDYIEMSKGSYDVIFKISGLTNRLFTVPNVSFEEGKIYTLAASGLVQLASSNPRSAKVTVITNK